MKKITISLFLVLLSLSTFASHILGGEIYYDQVSSTKYKLVLKLYRDVAGINLPNTVTIVQTSANTNNVNHTLSVSKTEYVKVQCNGSIEVKTYESVITVGSIPAGGYDFYWSSCCRAPGISNVSSSSGFYIKAKMLPLPGTSVAGNSPRFSSAPKFGIGSNITSTLSNFSIDPDVGDSLSTSFSALKENTGTNVSLNPAYTTSQPFDTNTVTTILHNTGLVKVVNPSNGVYAYAIKVKSYTNGVLTSVIHRDVITYVYPFMSNTPSTLVSNVNVAGGTHTAIGNTLNFEIAELGTIDFDFEAIFSGVSDTIELVASGNMLDTLYGGFCTGAYCASFVGNNGSLIGAGSAKGHFSFSPDTNFVSGFGTRSAYFLIEARYDDSCGVAQSEIATIHVKVKGATMFPEKFNYFFCSGGSVKAQIFGDTTNLLWSPSAGVSNPTSASPILSPIATTTYNIMNLNDSSSYFINVRVDTPITNFALNFNGSKASIPANITHTSVMWMYNGLPVAMNQDTLPILLSGSYYAIVTNKSCITSSDTLKVNFKNNSQSSNLNGSYTSLDSISAAEFWATFNLGDNNLTKINFVIPDNGVYKTSAISSLEIYEYSSGSIPIATLNVTKQSDFIWSTQNINVNFSSGKDYHFIINMNNDRIPLFKPDTIPYSDQNNFLTFKLATVKLNPVGVVNGLIPYMTFEFSSSIGLNEPLNLNHSIFPNPFEDKLTIKANGVNTILIYDELGRTVLEDNFINDIELSTEFLPNGIYFYEIKGENGIGSGKIIK